MKRKCIMIIIIVCVLMIPFYFYQKVYSQSHATPLKYRYVVIDPGHGGLDNGAMEYGYKEDDINLSISKLLKSELEYYGATVYLTRDGDYDMTKRNHHYSKQDDMYLRVKEIDKHQAHYLLSIHQNAANNSKAWGSQVFHYYRSEKGKTLANKIDRHLKEVTHSRKPISGCGFRVLRATQTVGVLIECGFMSNYNECGQLRNENYQRKLVEQIVKGLIEYDQEVTKKDKKQSKKILE